MPEKVMLYASIGPQLTHYDVDVENATLTRRNSVSLPANVHYAWPHASREYLYVASSNSASGIGGVVGDKHHVSGFRIDPATGALTPHGAPIPLPTRPIHMTSDIPSRHLLVAFSNPSGVRVYRVNSDATPGVRSPAKRGDRPGDLWASGPGQPRQPLAILVTRGHDAAAGKPEEPEEPGALKVFRYQDGQLTQEISVAPGGGYGFGPRHLDFHPTKPWVYVSLERQNRLDMFAISGDRLSPEPVFSKGTLAEPGNIRGRQVAGTIHVHPNGRFVYVANRASSTVGEGAERVFAGGENTLAVFAIDPVTGEPNPIQHIDTRGIHCRTLHIDPSGRLLVAAHIIGLPVREGSDTRIIPACFSVFRIGTDGRLGFVRKYDVDVRDQQMFWMGMV